MFSARTSSQPLRTKFDLRHKSQRGQRGWDTHIMGDRTYVGFRTMLDPSLLRWHRQTRRPVSGWMAGCIHGIISGHVPPCCTKRSVRAQTTGLEQSAR